MTTPAQEWSDPDEDGLAMRRRQRDDLRAARLAAGGNASLVELLLPLVHGRPTLDPASVDQQPASVTDDSGAPGTDVVRLFGRLISGDVHRLRFVHVHTTGVTATTVEADPVGAVRVSRPDRIVSWLDVLGSPAPDPLTLRYFLAGGSSDPSDVSPVAIRDALLGAMPAVGDPQRGALVLVPPHGRWRLLAELTERISARHPIAAWSVQVDPDAEPTSILARFLRHVPTRNPLELVLLDVDPDGTVWLRPEAVFPTGTTVDGPRPRIASVPLGPEACRREASFAVVVRQGDQPEQWRPAAVVRGRLPEHAGTALRVSFDGPQRIGFPDLDNSNLDRSATAWLRLLSRVPARIMEQPLDICVAVELTDPGGAGRLTFAADLIATLSLTMPPWTDPRIAAIGYHQHVDRRSRPDEQTRPVRAADFAVPADARRTFAGWRPQPNRNDHAAAVEDMLASLDRLGWRSDADRALVVIGSRPPYPNDRHDDLTPSCVHLLPWQEPAERLRTENGIRLVSVWQDPPWGPLGPADAALADRLTHARKVLGADALFELSATPPTDLAVAVAAEVTAWEPDPSSWIGTDLPFGSWPAVEPERSSLTRKGGAA